MKSGTRRGMNLDVALVWIHVTANVFWIGSIVAVGMLVCAESVDAKTRGSLAADLYRKLAAPAFAVSFLAGAARLFSDPAYYFKQTHFMHLKLLFVLIVIALHHVIGARAKKLASGQATDAGPTKMLLGVLAVSAAIATFAVVFKLPA